MSGFRVKCPGLGSVWSLWKALSLIEPKMSSIYHRKCSLEAFFEDPSKIEVWKLLEYFFLAAPGHLWMFLEASGPVLAAPGHSWALLAAPGHSWHFWKLLEHFWLLPKMDQAMG